MATQEELQALFEQDQVSEANKQAELGQLFEQGVAQEIPSEEEVAPQAPFTEVDGQLVQNVIDRTQERTAGEQIVGVGENLLSAALGISVGQFAQGIGTIVEGARRIGSGEIGTIKDAKEFQRNVEEFASKFIPQPQTEAGQEQATALGETLSPLAALTPLGAATQSIAKGLTAPKKFALLRKELGDIKQDVTPKVLTPKAKQEFAQIRKENPYSTDIVNYEKVGDRVKFDKVADNVSKQGYEEGVIASVKASSNADKAKMKQMLNIHKMGKKSAKFKALNRPADVVGKTVEERIKFVANKKKQAGKEVDVAANGLKGKSVNFDTPIQNFIKDLEDAGVTVSTDKGKLKINLKGSDIEGNDTSKALLKKVFKRLVHTDVPDGYGLHRAKRFIDSQVNFRKRQSDSLAANTERIVGKLRRGLNEELQKASPKYKRANAKFKDTLESLEEIQSIAGSKVDLDSPNVDKALGTTMRKVLSNYGSRVQAIDAVDKLNKTAQKYGMKQDQDIVNQLIFVNEIDRMFGAPAATSFKGQIEQSLKRGVDSPRGGIVDLAFDLAGKAKDKVKGINEEGAIKAMEEILNKKYQK